MKHSPEGETPKATAAADDVGYLSTTLVPVLHGVWRLSILLLHDCNTLNRRLSLSLCVAVGETANSEIGPTVLAG